MLEEKLKIPELENESRERLERLRSTLKATLTPLGAASQSPEVCIYATGSLARLEANQASDLDAFFLLSGNGKESPLGRIRDVKILNAVVSATEQNGFPDFSNDGEFLNFIHIDELIHHLGDREDDYHNMLTARMLLILESRSLFNDDLYFEMISSVIGRYFSDFHKHAKDFKPIFLLNDILRFWRTLCLNYENGRQWRTKDARRNAKGHLSNLKLQFSRCNMCFSFVAKLLSIGPAMDMAQVIEISGQTPLDRLRSLVADDPALCTYIDPMFAEYEWFLTSVSRSKEVVLDWISDKEERTVAFRHSNQFMDNMYLLVSNIAEKHNYLKYLVI